MDPTGPAGETGTTTVTADPSASRDVTLQHDIPCHRCGYDLRGLRGDGLCPECGAAIDDSVARFIAMSLLPAPPLPAAPRAWVATLAAGCTMIALLGVAVFVVTTMQLLIDPAWRRAWTPLQIVMVLAFWLLVWPEPSAAASTRLSDRLLRSSVALGATVCGGWMILRMSLLAIGLTRAVEPIYALIASATTAAALFHLARLADRLPRRGLRLEAAALMVLLPIATFCQVVFFPAIVFQSGRRWWTLPEPVIGDAAALIIVPYAWMLGNRWDIVLIFWTFLAALMLWTLALLSRFAIALWQAATAAREGSTP